MELIAVANIRSGRVTMGVTALRRLLAERPADPYLMTRLAEGLAAYRAPKKKRAALAILERLETTGQIADEHGRSILTHLRTRNADP